MWYFVLLALQIESECLTTSSTKNENTPRFGYTGYLSFLFAICFAECSRGIASFLEVMNFAQDNNGHRLVPLEKPGYPRGGMFGGHPRGLTSVHLFL